MMMDYKSETSLRVRVLYLLVLSFVVLIANVLILFFDLFSSSAYELVTSIFRGDMTRLGDFMGYLIILAVVLGCSAALISALIFYALVKTNHIVEIDPDARTVVVQYYSPWPWHRYRSSAYRFDEVERLELSYDDEQSRILLYLPDRKKPLELAAERRWHAAQQKFNRLIEIGLPNG